MLDTLRHLVGNTVRRLRKRLAPLLDLTAWLLLGLSAVPLFLIDSPMLAPGKRSRFSTATCSRTSPTRL